MGLKQIVARNVRKLRNERGLTQEELSELAGINRNYTGMIEREQRSPTVDVLEKLAKALQVEPAMLLQAGNERGSTGEAQNA
jgi:transcriptional regulator with XRE-family HTH domain